MTDITAKLAEALEPFAIFGDIITSDPAMTPHADDTPASIILFADGARRALTFGDLRSAKAVLTAYANELLTAYTASQSTGDETVERVQEPWPAKVQIGNHLFQNSYDDGSYYCYELRASIKFADRAALSALPRADDALEGLRELSERATKGEWVATGLVVFPNMAMSNPVAVCQRALGDAWDEAAANARFIEDCVNYVRARLAAQAGEM